MRLLVINPNISESVSSLILEESRRVAHPGTEIIMRTAPYGVEYIETRFEALLAGAAVAQVIAEEYENVDGIVVAAFGDPGLPALKEIVDLPVVGITEASLVTAALHGGRFSIVAISERIKDWYRECVEHNGLGSRLVSIRSLNESLGDIGSVQSDFQAQLLRLAHEVVNEGADTVILAGAPLAGLARAIDQQIPIPVVDGISAGIKQCEALVNQGGSVHRAGSLSVPPQKHNRGLSPELRQLLSKAHDNVHAGLSN